MKSAAERDQSELLTVKVKPAMLAALRELSERTRLPVSVLVRDAIEAWLHPHHARALEMQGKRGGE